MGDDFNRDYNAHKSQHPKSLTKLLQPNIMVPSNPTKIATKQSQQVTATINYIM